MMDLGCLVILFHCMQVVFVFAFLSTFTKLDTRGLPAGIQLSMLELQVQIRKRFISAYTPILGNYSGAVGFDDVPVSGRRPVNTDVCLPVAIIVTGYRGIST